MKEGLLGATLRRVTEGAEREEAHSHDCACRIGSQPQAVGRHCLLDERGERLEVGAAAQKVKGLAPLACKTDRIDAWVLAEPESCRVGWAVAAELAHALRSRGTARLNPASVCEAPSK